MSETPTVLRAVIASDNFLTREGLSCLFSGVRSIDIVARVDSHPDTLEAVRQYRPDVLVVGIRTPRVNAEAALSSAQLQEQGVTSVEEIARSVPGISSPFRRVPR